jgi:serine/threonine-protein kinase HipA
MAFNVVARNHDDHSKNFSFVLDQNNQWQLSPAYDLAYSYKPGSKWVDQHWLSLNGKRDGFVRGDFYTFQKVSHLFKSKWVDEVIEEVTDAVSQWPDLAREHGVPKGLIKEVGSNLRLKL